MARGYEARVGMDARAFNKALKDDVIKPVDDAARALDDLADAGDDAGRDASRSVGKLEDALRDAQRQSEKTGESLGDDLSKGARKGADGAKKGLDDVKDEAQQSGREAAASFSGEFDDVTDYVQEVVAQGLGPAGIAGAAVIGSVTAVATAAVEAWNEKVQGIKDATAEMWQEAAAEGQSFLDTEAIRAEAHRILWDDAYQEQLRAAEDAGVTRTDLAIALAAGEGEVFDRVHRQIMDAREDEKQSAIDSMNASIDGNVAIQDAVTSVNSELARTVTILEEKAKAQDENKRKAQEAADVTNALGEQERAQIQRTRDADQARWEAHAKARQRASQPITVPVVPDSSAFESHLSVLRRRAEQGIVVKLRPEQGRAWE